MTLAILGNPIIGKHLQQNKLKRKKTVKNQDIPREQLYSIKDWQKILDKEYPEVIESYIAPIIYEGIELISVLIYPFGDWRINMLSKLFDAGEKLTKDELNQMKISLPKEVKSLLTEKEIYSIECYSKIEDFFADSFEQISISKYLLPSISFFDTYCILLINCSIFCVQNNIYSEVRTEISELLFRGMVMYENLINREVANASTITEFTEINAQILSVGGKEPSAIFSLVTGETITCFVGEENAKILGNNLYKDVLLKGVSHISLRDSKIVNFDIEEFSILEKVDFDEHLGKLSKIVSPYLNEIEDIDGFLNDLREEE